MKILKDLIEKANDTLEEIEWYAEKAHNLKATHKHLADTYIKVAEIHEDIYGMLHEKMIELIEEKKEKGVEVPKIMEDIWEYEHKNLIKDYAEVKYMIEEYKKLNY